MTLINRQSLQSEKGVYLISCFFLIIASIFSIGYYHVDEHWQILEFAGSKLNLISTDNLPWEYAYQIRSSIQPVFVVQLYKLLDLVGLSNPFTVSFVLRILSAALSFYSMYMLYKVYRPQIKDAILQKWFLTLSFLLWFAIYNAVRFSSEGWSGTLFIIGYAHYFLIKKENYFNYLVVGLMLGLSFLFRFQLGFLSFGFVLWMVFIRKEKLNKIAYIFSGILLALLIGVISDRWFYGEWTMTAWNYFEQNIIYDVASKHGVSLWWYYITQSIQATIPPFSLLIVLSFILVFVYKKSSPLTWSLLPFLLIHFVIAHKEIRFLFPIIGFIPIIIIKGIEIIQNKWAANILKNKVFLVFMKTFIVINFLSMVFVSLRPSENEVLLYKSIYDQYQTPVMLYYFEKNPYHAALDIYFYKRENLEFKQINSLDSIQKRPGMTNLLVLSNSDKAEEFRANNRLVYMSFPPWIQKFNINNWLDRANIWYVYEVEE